MCVCVCVYVCVHKPTHTLPILMNIHITSTYLSTSYFFSQEVGVCMQSNHQHRTDIVCISKGSERLVPRISSGEKVISLELLILPAQALDIVVLASLIALVVWSRNICYSGFIRSFAFETKKNTCSSGLVCSSVFKQRLANSQTILPLQTVF